MCVFKQVEAVQLIADGEAPKVPQTEEGASYEGIQKKSNAKVRSKLAHSLDTSSCLFAICFQGSKSLVMHYIMQHEVWPCLFWEGVFEFVREK